MAFSFKNPCVCGIPGGWRPLTPRKALIPVPAPIATELDRVRRFCAERAGFGRAELKRHVLASRAFGALLVAVDASGVAALAVGRRERAAPQVEPCLLQARSDPLDRCLFLAFSLTWQSAGVISRDEARP